MNTPDYVLEFVVHSITCRNFSAQASPLRISIPLALDMTINPSSTTLSKITYEKGKRIFFNHDNLLNLECKFDLINGHGNFNSRGSCKIDFFTECQEIEKRRPFIYEVNACLISPNNKKIGIMKLSFQMYTFRNFINYYPNVNISKIPEMPKTPPTNLYSRRQVQSARKENIKITPPSSDRVARSARGSPVKKQYSPILSPMDPSKRTPYNKHRVIVPQIPKK